MAEIINLPPVNWNSHQNEQFVDTAPSECDVHATLVDLSVYLFAGRPPRSKPCLVVDNTRRVITDDLMHASIDFAGGPDDAA